MKKGTIAVKGAGLILYSASSRLEFNRGWHNNTLKKLATALYTHGLITKDYVKEPSTSEFMWELINYLRSNHT